MNALVHHRAVMSVRHLEWRGLLAAAALGLPAGCSPPLAQPAVCAAYQACFLDDDGAGLRTLGASDDAAVACYAAFADDGADDAVALLSQSYGAGGLCTEPTGDAAADAATSEACAAHCRRELAADCRRLREGGLSVCTDPCGDAAVEDSDDPATLPTCGAP